MGLGGHRGVGGPDGGRDLLLFGAFYLVFFFSFSFRGGVRQFLELELQVQPCRG